MQKWLVWYTVVQATVKDREVHSAEGVGMSKGEEV